MRRRAKVDSNQPKIIEALRRCGAYVVLTHQLKNAFDCIAFYQGKTFIIEIKDGTLTPSRQRLTEGEAKCKEMIESRGCSYHVITSVDEALELLL